MQVFARVVDGVVVELLPEFEGGVALAQRFEAEVTATCFPIPAALPQPVRCGWRFVGGVYLEPAAEPAAAAPASLSPLAFMERLTAAERAAIAQAVPDDASVMMWMMGLSSAASIDLAAPGTASRLQFLVAKGLLAEARVAEVLAP